MSVMASLIYLLLFLFAATFSDGASHNSTSIRAALLVYPIPCSPADDPVCDSYLYIIPDGLSPSAVAAQYSTRETLVLNVTRPTGRADFLVGVPCQCLADGQGGAAYLHETKYKVKSGDTPDKVTGTAFSGLAWNIPTSLVADQEITVLLPCGCRSPRARGAGVATYAVENGDTLSTIARLLNSDIVEIEKSNVNLTADPDSLTPGWVLFVPTGTGPQIGPSRPVPPPPPEQDAGKKGSVGLAVGVSTSIAFLIVGALLLIYRWRKLRRRANVEDAKMNADQKAISLPSIAALEKQYLPNNPNKKMEDHEQFETDRPMTFSLKDVETATSSFDDTRKIGEGGYGSVYHGVLANQEVAIKRMKSTMSKEFFAELKVLCKVHHINVVELIGYAAGDDYLYLVYEFVQNGSLGDHLHDPLLKGNQPLSWNARAQIALDAARGIEYIHDHTKARYVHRDIKTTNILLGNGFRAKVADFGLVKLVERSNEDEFLATRLVGTPGYLPPEAVRELQMTSKTDVFAFGVVLAELITGYRALVRDNTEPTRLRSLVSIMNGVFHDDDPERALEEIMDGNLKNYYPLEEVYKMASISEWCMREDPLNRPEMREITMRLNQIVIASTEWEASLGGNSQVFSGMFNGR